MTKVLCSLAQTAKKRLKNTQERKDIKLRKENIKKFMDIVAGLLGIEYNLVYDSDGLLNDASAGVPSYDNKISKTILINNNILNTKNRTELFHLFLILAHELRHIWQYKFHRNLYFSEKYVNSDSDEASYELQECEIDANAFALFVTNSIFRGIPKKGTWMIYSYDKIIERFEEIKREYASQKLPWANLKVY